MSIPISVAKELLSQNEIAPEQSCELGNFLAEILKKPFLYPEKFEDYEIHDRFQILLDKKEPDFKKQTVNRWKSSILEDLGGTSHPAVQQFLIYILENDDWRGCRLKAMSILRECFHHNIYAYIRSILKEEASSKEWVCIILDRAIEGLIDSPILAPSLEKFLKSKDFFERAGAARLLCKISGKRFSSYQRAVGRIPGLGFRSPSMDFICLIGGLAHRFPFLKAFSNAAMDEFNRRFYFLRSALTLLESPFDDSAIPFLRGFLRHGDHSISFNAAVKLAAEFSDIEGIKYLERQALDKNLAYRQSAIQELYKLGIEKYVSMAEKEIEAAVRADDISHLVPMAFKQMHRKEILLKLLKKIFAKDSFFDDHPPGTEEVNENGKGKTTFPFRSYLFPLFFHLANPFFIPFLTELLRHRDIDVRSNAAFALYTIGDPSVVKDLAAVLDDIRPTNRAGAIEFIGKRANSTTLAYIAKFLEDDDKGVVKSAIAAFHHARDPAFIPNLIPLIEHSDFYVRLAASTDLWKLGNKIAVDKIVEFLYGDNLLYQVEAAKSLLINLEY